MRAILIDRFGGPEVLRIGEAPTPVPGRGQVRIRVAAAAVNPADYKEREGSMGLLGALQFPYVPGHDAAGVIDQIGTSVSRFKLGDRVMTTSDHLLGGGGSYAEYVVVAGDHVGLAPASISFVEAAAMPVASRTAWQALFAPGKGAAKPGCTVLWHGGSGGTGSFGVQFAKARGLRVAATCRTENVEYVKSLGADFVIDYRNQSIQEAMNVWAPAGADLIVDAVSGETLAEPLTMVRRGGRIVQIATGTDDGDIQGNIAAAAQGGVTHVFAICDFEGAPAEMALLADLVDSGQVKMPPIEVFPLENAALAQSFVETRHTRGKVALIVADP